MQIEKSQIENDPLWAPAAPHTWFDPVTRLPGPVITNFKREEFVIGFKPDGTFDSMYIEVEDSEGGLAYEKELEGVKTQEDFDELMRLVFGE